MCLFENYVIKSLKDTIAQCKPNLGQNRYFLTFGPLLHKDSKMLLVQMTPLILLKTLMYFDLEIILKS